MDLKSNDQLKKYFRFFNFHQQSDQFNQYINDYQLIPLVTLEQAIQPLVDSIPDINQMIELIKRKCHQPKDNLSIDELASIMLYTIEWKSVESSFYNIFNHILSDNDQNTLKSWYLYIKLFSTALSKLSISSSRIFYRAVPLNLQNQYSKDSQLIWHDYVSCSTSIEFFQQQKFNSILSNDRTIFTIYTEHAIDISQYSFYPLNETVLLPSNQRYRVISCRTLSNGFSMIILKEITEKSIPRTVIHENEYELYERILKKHRIKKRKYTEISFRNQNLTDDHIDIIVKYATNEKSCQWLSFENNRITSYGFSILINRLNENRSLETLHFSQNFLTDFGIECLAKILANQFNNLTFLNLCHNHIRDDGAKYLARALEKNKILLDLWLSYNEIGNDGAEALADVFIFDNTTLMQLYLNGNSLINDLCVYPFIQVVKSNQNLNTLWLQDCSFTVQSKNRLKKTEKARKDLYLYV